MLKEERAYLEYKPRYTYSKVIMTHIESLSSYNPSELVEQLLQQNPSELIKDLEDTMQIAKVLAERLKQCLTDTDKPLNTAYKDALHTNNASLAHQTLQQNTLDENGVTQINVLDLVMDCETTLTYLIDCAKSAYYDASILHHGTMQAHDEARMKKIIEADQNNALTNNDELSFQSLLFEMLTRFLNNCKNLIKDTSEVLYSTINNVYNNNITEILTLLNDVPHQTLKTMIESNNVQLRTLSVEVSQHTMQYKTLNDPLIKKDLLHLFCTAHASYAANRELSPWLATIDTQSDLSASTCIVEDLLDQTKLLYEKYNTLLTDTLKQTYLEQMLQSEVINQLKLQKSSRQKTALFKAVLEEKSNGTFDGEQFVKKHQLEQKGTLCSL